MRLKCESELCERTLALGDPVCDFVFLSQSLLDTILSPYDKSVMELTIEHLYDIVKRTFRGAHSSGPPRDVLKSVGPCR